MLEGLKDWTYRRYWADETRPYQHLRDVLAEKVGAGTAVLDQGCGYRAPTLCELKGRGATLRGIDLVEFDNHDPDLDLHKGDLARTPYAEKEFDLVYSRSVMEHVVDPNAVYAETNRILKPGGRWLFLTANRWDYVSLVARAVPNRLHRRIVRTFEGRNEADTFPTAYRTNDRKQIGGLAARHGFQIRGFEYLSQYPSMFVGNGAAFLAATAYEKLLMDINALRGLRGWLFVELEKS
ncbi:MAG: class I SAM-dependent methyltransferase [Pacificimonas sp.]